MEKSSGSGIRKKRKNWTAAYRLKHEFIGEIFNILYHMVVKGIMGLCKITNIIFPALFKVK